MQILTYRLSVFGDFKRFAPTTSKTIEWTQMFQAEGYELLPTIINQPLIPGIPPFVGQSIPSENRIQFVSSKNDLFVRILAERVDVEMTHIESDDFEDSLNGRLNDLVKILKLMLDALKEVQGTRLAYYVDMILPEKNKNMFKPFYAKNDLGIIVKEAGDCVEWNHRFNKRVKINVNHVDELCNCILLLEDAVLQVSNAVSGEQQSISGLHIISDINTLAENCQPRFSSESLEAFSADAQKILFDIFAQVEEMLKKEN